MQIFLQAAPKISALGCICQKKAVSLHRNSDTNTPIPMRNKTLLLFFAAFLLGCSTPENRLRQRADELCRYIPDHEHLERSKGYLTEDFYAVLDTMFHQQAEEDVAYEWLFYFVTNNGSRIEDYEVTDVNRTDAGHAIATIRVRQHWEDGSFDEETDIEEHTLSMERVDGIWLMSDFDGHKAHCIQRVERWRKEHE